MNPPLTSSGLWSFLKAKSKSGPFEGCLNIFNPLIKLTIQSQVYFKASLFWLFCHLDYFVWRLWKEPRHVSRVANSRDNVQVRKFSAIFARIFLQFLQFLQEFLHLNVPQDPFLQTMLPMLYTHWWFASVLQTNFNIVAYCTGVLQHNRFCTPVQNC